MVNLKTIKVILTRDIIFLNKFYSDRCEMETYQDSSEIYLEEKVQKVNKTKLEDSEEEEPEVLEVNVDVDDKSNPKKSREIINLKETKGQSPKS